MTALKISIFSAMKQGEFYPRFHLIFVEENKNPLCSVSKHKTEGMPALESSSGGFVTKPARRSTIEGGGISN